MWTVRWIDNQTTSFLLMHLKTVYVKILGFQSGKNLGSNPLSYNTMFYINVRTFVTNFNTIWDFLFLQYRMHSTYVIIKLKYLQMLLGV
jgi:hypothetical protein